jgi:hypothetical protein
VALESGVVPSKQTRRLHHKLAFVQQRIIEAEGQRDQLVGELIAAGATWRDVGEALDLTPRAASKRYSDRCARSARRDP